MQSFGQGGIQGAIQVDTSFLLLLLQRQGINDIYDSGLQMLGCFGHASMVVQHLVGFLFDQTPV